MGGNPILTINFLFLFFLFDFCFFYLIPLHCDSGEWHGKSTSNKNNFDQKTSHTIQGSPQTFNFFYILNIEDNVDFKCGGIVCVFSHF